MKKRSFLAGMLVMALIGGLGFSALAASGQFTITVDPINIQVNGEVFAPKDANGADVPVFAYNGTTYAPLRALAEAYGLKVDYDGNAKMASVVDPEKTPDTDNSAAANYDDWSKAVDQNGNPLQYKVEKSTVRCFVNDVEVIPSGSMPLSIIYSNTGYVNLSYICNFVGDEIVLPPTDDWDRGAPAYIQLGEVKYVSYVFLVSAKNDGAWFFSNYEFDGDAKALRLTTQ